MSKVVISTQMTVDGVIDSPDEWPIPDGGLEARFEAGEWVIESSIRRSHAQGQDLIRAFPTRVAVEVDEFAAELTAAATP